MKLEEFADLLNGRGYGEEISKDEEAIAKQFGYVICLVSTEEKLELRGAIRAEFDAWDVEEKGLTIPSGRIIAATTTSENQLGAYWRVTVNDGLPFWLISNDEVLCCGCVFRLEEA